MNAKEYFENGIGDDCIKIHKNLVIELMTNYAEHKIAERLKKEVNEVFQEEVEPYGWISEGSFYYNRSPFVRPEKATLLYTKSQLPALLEKRDRDMFRAGQLHERFKDVDFEEFRSNYGKEDK